MSDLDPLLDALARAAFAPQKMVMYAGDGTGRTELVDAHSPLMQTLASYMQKELSQNEELRALVIAELTKPEHIKTLADEIAKGIGRMRVSAGGWQRAVDVPEWINDALSESLIDWLGTSAADELLPQMLQRADIKITVERKDANAK